jgi:hypothetical protein
VPRLVHVVRDDRDDGLRRIGGRDRGREVALAGGSTSRPCDGSLAETTPALANAASATMTMIDTPSVRNPGDMVRVTSRGDDNGREDKSCADGLSA